MQKRENDKDSFGVYQNISLLVFNKTIVVKRILQEWTSFSLVLVLLKQDGLWTYK
ncbi:hypothetical protein Mucpa_0061 [Mucilaginibacter paludis DSM 18603]|uniref:Uncharacterized protein n=1 Tax=Mucilaginibacter paludis DSM 18603 TaxID=714943 RepID=H1YDS4_9SPHI|nr:hypothetical protein Mucpa_0061 [Mucilaginibacter paludis DSM 18603]